MTHRESHRSQRIGWLRAAVLGANDGIVSTASLMVGVAASGAARGDVLVAGVAGLVAGSLSMAAGEYVSVSTQADTEAADLAIERRALATQPEAEETELAQIYERRGLAPELALEVARALTKHDAVGAHARDELGFSEAMAARPLQAAAASAASFAAGATLPIVVMLAVPLDSSQAALAAASLVSLAALGALAARAGGAGVASGAARVAIWGAVAMAATALVGWLFGTTTA